MLKRKPGRAVSELAIILLLFYCKTASALPAASFTSNVSSGCLPLNVQFNSTTAGAVAWYWDLGNGNSSTLQNPSNVYTAPGNYTITLIAFYGNGTADTARYPNYISVFGKPTAGFVANATTGCPEATIISFSNTSTNGAISYLWDFGDGTTSTQANPGHVYNHHGTFSITLIATNAFGCQDILIRNQYITIHPKPDATAHATATSTCNPATPFQFSNSAQNAVAWNWSFGDGSYSPQQNPTHTFPAPGNYYVSTIVTNSFGCRDTSDTPLHIIVGLNDWADFAHDIDSGCANLTVNFYNTNANVVTSTWDFGDGTTSLFANISHTYTTGGDYTVSLMVTSLGGCADTVTKTNLIHVADGPAVSFSQTNTSGCAPLSIQFTNTSTNYDSCVWFFGDGTSSTAANPIHTYSNSGRYSVILQCWGSSGCSRSLTKTNLVTVTQPQAEFSATSRIGCPPLLASFNAMSPGTGSTFLWDFGDGSTSNLANPAHLYSAPGNFNVMLTVTDSLGCVDTIHKTNYIQAVNAAANYMPPPTKVGCLPFTAQFTDAYSGSTAWLWDFGDGTTSTQQNPAHIYSTPGIFTVSLTTTAPNGGCSQTISNFSTFNIQGGYAGFTQNQTNCPPYIANFQDTSLNAVTWLWDFGDGHTSTQQNPSHAFADPGYYSVSLTITTAGGCKYTTMHSNAVYFPVFGASFYGQPLDTVFPCPVQFHANSIGATSWLWDFGDGSSSTLENPLHTFILPGTYNVSLTISNGTCSLTYSPPPFDFGQPDTSAFYGGPGPYSGVQRGCSPLPVLFTNKVNGAISWQWNFGDGHTSTDEFPYHTYMNPGIYSVTLTTTDTSGITHVLSLDSIVYADGPVTGFSLSQEANCSNTEVAITDTSQNASYWFWDFGDGGTDTIQNPSHSFASTIPNYIVTQTVTDSTGCSASLSTSIFTYFLAPIIASDNEICGIDTIEFSTSLQNYMTYSWDFGDGNTSSLMNPSHIYTTEGIYSVTLTVTDYGNCTQTYIITEPITVNIPTADFVTIGQRKVCDEANVRFISTSTNADIYEWNLGDGSISSLQNPTHIYRPGVYDVALTVYRGSCSDVKHFPQHIVVDTAHAAFTYTTDQICEPVTATFQDQSINPVSWLWNFCDNDFSSVQNPVHVFHTRPFCYPALIMTDMNGCSDTVSATSFPVLAAGFYTSADSGCLPHTVQFTNTSTILTNTWYWDFGDGTTSTLKNPSHTYTQPGTYDIMLIVGVNSIACRDTLIWPKKIVVREPAADFISSDLRACAPSLVNFINLSSDANKYLWDFGDGSTSTNYNPVHVYNNPGVYSVTLLSSNTLGCSDSIMRGQYIHVIGPRTNFSASEYSGCSPLTVQFTDSSINAFSYSWNFGDGYSDFSQNPVHTFRDTGSFTVSLVTTDTSGCINYFELPQPVEILDVPHAAFSVSDSTGCMPLTTLFTDLSTNMIGSTWHFGDGDTASAATISHTYVTAGNFDAFLVAINTEGCTDTARLSQGIEVDPLPVAQFSVADIVGCVPFHVTFSDQSLNLDGPQYFWNFGNGLTSTDANPSTDFLLPGSYSVSVTITNQTGCSSTAAFPSYIHVRDTIPPHAPKILSVSVESNTSVKIIWENVSDVDLATYVIWRSDPGAIGLRQIASIPNLQNTNFTVTSEYVDYGLNTLQNTYTYKVQALDTCANSIPLDSLIPHTTINISSQRLGNGIYVSWTPYDGCPINTYQLYRAAPGGQFTYLTTLDNDTLNYYDSSFVCPYPYSYRVMATDLCGNIYTSYSDTSQTFPINNLEGQIVDATRSTVVDNKFVLTEWLQPQVHPEMVSQFDIFRSTDNENFLYRESVPALQTDYIDYDVDVQNEHYYYKILVVNTCAISEDISGSTSTIILRGEMNDARRVHLSWSPYVGWDTGVEYYILEKKDADGHWQILRQVSGTELEYDYQD